MWTPFHCLIHWTPNGKAIGFFPIVSRFTEKLAECMLGGRFFLLSGTILSMDQCQFISRQPWPCGGSRLPSIQRSLDRLISGQCKIFESISRHFIIWGSNKFKSVISSLYVPWIPGVSFRLNFWFQIHTLGEIYLLAFLGYIYTGHGRGLNNNSLRLKPSVSLV